MVNYMTKNKNFYRRNTKNAFRNKHLPNIKRTNPLMLPWYGTEEKELVIQFTDPCFKSVYQPPNITVNIPLKKMIRETE